MKGIEKVYVEDFGEALKYLNHNTEVLSDQIDKLEKVVKILRKKNNFLALSVICLAGALYLVNNKINSLELKVNSIENVNNFVKEDDFK